MSEDRTEYKVPGPTPALDFNAAFYLGDEQDGCYFDATKGPGGWYCTIIVNCGSTGFIDSLLENDGPYMTRADAIASARRVAVDWCTDNEVEWADD